MDTTQDYREPTHDERYGSLDTETLDRIYSALGERGYALKHSFDIEDIVLVKGEREITAYPSERGLELCLFDDFSNPFKMSDFDSVNGYLDALEKRFDELCQEHAES